MENLSQCFVLFHIYSIFYGDSEDQQFNSLHRNKSNEVHNLISAPLPSALYTLQFTPDNILKGNLPKMRANFFLFHLFL